MRRLAGLIASLILCASTAWALGGPSYVTTAPREGAFVLADTRSLATLRVDSTDWPGVVRAAHDLQADVERVTSRRPSLVTSGTAPQMVLIGTVGKSPLIDGLAASGKIDVSGIRGKWESFFLQTVANPLPGVASALVIAGSDKRGTIYGIYDLSEQIGVSPWYWWADVTPDHRDALYVLAGKHQQGEPSVKYRGIFLNDEKPDLDYWVRAKFGEHPSPGGTGTVASMNSQFYTKLFEVILRMKGNYLWPAMWNNAFAEDDRDNPRLADEYGIVMGTSHQEPMMRAQKEWDWHLRAANGNWNYSAHPDVLNQFWREGIRERKGFENIYTIGLRGENDTAMVRTAAEGVQLTEKIVAVQRQMLAQEVAPDVTKIPQMWSLYKEVQNYYEDGLRVPDDVTLLWAEDNWGNIRRLPTPEERKRSGGAGVYYHFDYHGGPRSYQWLNASPIPKIWEQMTLAKQYGADRIWIVNVGHFKGYEVPMEFFLNLGWNSSRWTGENVNEFMRLWAEREFGSTYASEAADIVAKYAKYNARRKPELLEASTYSLVHFDEAERVVAEYNALAARAETLYRRLPEAKRDAFYQLALFPAKASANLNEMYVAAAKNALYTTQGRASTNDWAAKVQQLFDADVALTREFHALNGGKWDHFMDQPHIGYTSWQDPPENSLRAVKLTKIDVPEAASMGVFADGGTTTLPAFDSLNQQRSYIEIYNRGRAPFEFTAKASAPWITLSATSGRIERESRIGISIDWTRAPEGDAQGSVTINGTGRTETIAVAARKPAELTRTNLKGFAEGAGYVAIEAEHYSRKVDAGTSHFTRIDDYGHTLSGMLTAAPVDTNFQPGWGPVLEYDVNLFTSGEQAVRLTLGPALNFAPDRGVRIAVSFDTEEPQTVTIVPQGYNAQNGNRDWEQSVRDNARFATTKHTLDAGKHTLKIWMIDPGVVLQRIVVNTPAAASKVSYLGAPESFHN
jgi:hypothetical protein